jgi:hypothetical protein
MEQLVDKPDTKKMKIKKILDRIRENGAEGSMTFKFFNWLRNKEPRCKVCGVSGIENEFSNEKLCFSCYYDKLLKEKKE